MRLSKTLQIAVLSSLCAFSALSAAATNLLQNGSFEAGSWSNNTGSGWMNVALGSTAITGWTLVNNNVAWSAPGNADGIVPLDGIHSLDLTGMGNISPNGGVMQTISTIAGQSYTLSFYLDAVVGYGIPASVLAQAGGASQTFSKSTNGWQAYSLDLSLPGRTPQSP